ncbi:phosphopantetheine-binding protein [Actinosynnema sp. NPDC059335]|uniref:phosphopantetheine-binding protein n=1 Tax=Actinosynnema sp. NPDC059335 TaxID=3346804 RepID=UPI0036715B6D
MTESTTATSRERIVDAITTVLSEVLAYELPEVTEGSRLLDDLGLDSTGVYELLMELEEALEVEFDTDNLERAHFETVRSLTDFVAAEMDR